ncbi:DUF3795 domain-containing protein [uncultured Ruminococcus sp.]|uniref:DUF3795 domain-containing protein n=1 Tax=uncultured Ruminococcus sp. TaxID=165186 RepID=UPI00343DEABC
MSKSVSVCGIDCSVCYCFEKSMCTGCDSNKGKVFHCPPDTECAIYGCCVTKHGYRDCSECGELPCEIWNSTRDPKYSDEEFAKNIADRVEMLKNGRLCFSSEYADVRLWKNRVLLTWKKEAKFENYRSPTCAALELMGKYSCDLVIDARNGFEDEKADVEWGFTFLLPEMAKTGCKTVWFIMNEVNENEIGEEMDMWGTEFGKYFTVRKVDSSEKVSD